MASEVKGEVYKPITPDYNPGDDMIPVEQTKLHSENQNGNCLAASLSSILEISLSDVPEFENMGEEWWPKMMRWLESLGLYMIQWREEVVLPGYYLVMGVSPRNKSINHQVVFRNGKLVHDPHPSKAGVSEIKQIMALLPFDPANYNKRIHEDAQKDAHL